MGIIGNGVFIGGGSKGVPEFSYTGSYSIVDDTGNTIATTDYKNAKNWNIKFLSSGTLTITKLNGAKTIDVFAVGGGGSGGKGMSSSSAGGDSGGGGGGGGYTNKTTTPYRPIINTNYSIVIGAGGTVSGSWGDATGHNGNPSSAFGISASGGNCCSGSTTGGSGTGKGGNGSNSGNVGGDGVFPFYENNYLNYKYGAGGGGGGYTGGTGTKGARGGYGQVNVSNPVPGGGWGKGLNNSNFHDGKSNSGGGGGGGANSGGHAGSEGGNGGSGIVIIRNARK